MQSNKSIDKTLNVLISENFLVNLDEDNETLTPHTVPGWDSLSHMKLVVALEKQFSIRFETSDIEEMLSVQKIRDCVKKRLKYL